MIGSIALIIHGECSGQMCTIGYIYYKNENGFCQMEENDDYQKRYLVIPHFDHCGEPKMLDKAYNEVKILPLAPKAFNDD